MYDDEYNWSNKERSNLGIVIAVLFLLGACFLLWKMINPAGADEGACGPTEKIEAYLTEHYKETFRAAGIIQDGPPMKIFRNPETGTWTLLVRKSADISCAFIAGKDWNETEGQGL